MFTTSFGDFNGTSWEKLMQAIFKVKYMSLNYRNVPASPGDFGLEGFTNDGQIFQCYCPDHNMDTGTLYEKQRDKITADINKLKSNSVDITRILGGVKIKLWVLVTPRNSHNGLLGHCVVKRDLVKSWNLPFVDNSCFDVVVREIDDYQADIGEFYRRTEAKITIRPDKDATSSERIQQWKDVEIDLVDNALRKNAIRIYAKLKNNDASKTNRLTELTTEHFLRGESILQEWASFQPENHQRFIEFQASMEEELPQRCMLTTDDPNNFIENLEKYVEKKIRVDFEFLDQASTNRLKNYLISNWILRCPITFDNPKTI